MIGAILGFISNLYAKIKIMASENMTGNLDANVTDTSILGTIISKTDVTNFDRTTDSLEAIRDELANVGADISVPAADAIANVDVADVVGNKSDALVEAVGSTKSLMGYMKGLIQEMAQRTVAKTAFDQNNADNTLEDIVNITDKGVLTGISCAMRNGSATVTFIITIDGVALTDVQDFATYNTADTNNSLAFNHRFNTSLRVQHKKSTTNGNLYSNVSYTVD